MGHAVGCHNSVHVPGIIPRASLVLCHINEIVMLNEPRLVLIFKASSKVTDILKVKEPATVNTVTS